MEGLAIGEILTSHPGIEYQRVAEFGVILNYHEFARKLPASIKWQCQILSFASK